MKYEIVSSTSRSTLVTKVNTEISDGWRPIGGVTYDGAVYLQAMYMEASNSMFDGLFLKPRPSKRATEVNA